MFRFHYKDKSVARQAMEACETIITEMGADIHDDLIQKLSVLRLHLDKIERSSFDPEETRNAVLRMQADFQLIIDSVRRISRQLSPVRMDDDSIEKRLEMLCQNMETPGTGRIYHSFTGTVLALDTNIENYLFRMIQELMHNAFRHSAAWNIWVTWNWMPKAVVITVEDDGSGFSRLEEFIARLKKKHNSLRMRANAIGATIKYSAGEKGLCAQIKLPL